MARHNRKHKLSKKEQKALSKESLTTHVGEPVVTKRRDALTVALEETVTLAELARRSGRSPAEIVGALLRNGVIATVNDSVDRETVEIVAEELDLIIKPTEEITAAEVTTSTIEPTPRPPVVVVLGHVDHGKTTLLDTIRKTNVVASESGGITQHIGAYQVEVRESEPKSRASDTSRGIPSIQETLRQAQGDFSNRNRKITFIDTPGHEAFSAMRAHGVTLTDIAILVVAADDGVRPQTKEAISHAKAANIQIIVAINKIDKPGAAPDRVKGELAELGLAAEGWGGKTPTVLVSAKEGTGIEELLDTVILVADLADLQARPTGPADGVVIEAHKELGVGPVATVLIQQGELHIGDPVAIGAVAGKVRVMQDASGTRHAAAGPSMPVRVAGLEAVPSFGAHLVVARDERAAHDLARTSALLTRKQINPSVSNQDDEGSIPTLSIIVKADVDGSLAAIAQSLESLGTDEVAVRVVSQSVGDLSESDVNLALAAVNPYLVAFRTGATVAARMLARSKQLTIHAYDIIYRLIEDVTAQAKALREPQYEIRELGRLKVLQIFRTTKTAQIVGGRIEQGSLERGAAIEIVRDGEPVGSGTIETLQRGTTKADTVAEG